MTEPNGTGLATRKSPSLLVMLAATVPLGAAIIAMVLARAAGVNSDGTFNWTEIGARGDWWGGHFSAAAALTSAILFFYAVWLQHSELQATREEMRQARLVHEAQKQQLERQATIAEKSAQQIHIFDILERRQDSYDRYMSFFDSFGGEIVHLAAAHEYDSIVFDYKQSRDRLFAYDTYLDKMISISQLNTTEKKQVRELADLFPHGLRNED